MSFWRERVKLGTEMEVPGRQILKNTGRLRGVDNHRKEAGESGIKVAIIQAVEVS